MVRAAGQPGGLPACSMRLPSETAWRHVRGLGKQPRLASVANAQENERIEFSRVTGRAWGDAANLPLVFGSRVRHLTLISDINQRGLKLEKAREEMMVDADP